MIVGYQIGEQGANHRVWNKIVRTTDAHGNPTLVTIRAYVELATGLNRPDPVHPGNWIPSTPEIVPCPGGAIAQGCQHTVRFADNLNTAGAIDLTMPNGRHLVSNLLGLSYFDPTSGKTVLLAEITNCEGQIVGSNEVLYAQAFSGLSGSVLCKYTKAAFEQDVILSEQPPSPQSLGLSDNAVLQVLTEFTSFPTPTIRPLAAGTATNVVATPSSPLTDEWLDFGSMKMVPGRAFLLGTNSASVAATPPSPPVPVCKQWLTVGGRTVLVESVPLAAITNSLSQLPAFAATSLKPSAGSVQYVVSNRRLLPPPRAASGKRTEMELAKFSAPAHGLALDYITVSSSSAPYTFQGDTTYFLSSAVDMSGRVTFEGGAVLKFARGASLTIDSTAPAVVDTATSYRPTVFTAEDDTSVGSQIMEEGTLSGYYASTALNVENTGAQETFSNMRILYAQQALEISYAHGMPFYDIQIVNCQYGVYVNSGGVSFYNALFADDYGCFVEGYEAEATIENGTFASIRYLVAHGYNFQVNAVNSIMSNVASLTDDSSYNIQFNGSFNGFYGTQPFGSNQIPLQGPPFQTAAGGSYYLATTPNGGDASGFRGKGTTSIDPTLLNDLKTKTTHAPTVLPPSQQITSDYTMSPQVPRYTGGTPDLGYYYDALDYVVDNLQITASAAAFTVTVQPGTAVGVAGGTGFQITVPAGTSTPSLVFDGVAAAPCYLVSCDTVQEQGDHGTGISNPGGAPLLTLELYPTFTCFCSLADEMNFVDGTEGYFGWNPNNCEFFNGILSGGGQAGNSNTGIYFDFENCLFDRCGISDGIAPNSLLFCQMQSCTAHGGDITLTRSQDGSAWPIHAYDSAFDGTSISVADSFNGQSIACNNNAYLPNAPTMPNDQNDVTVTAGFNWQKGNLGDFYLPDDPPALDGTLLIDKGDQPASQEPPDGLMTGSSGYGMETSHLDIYTTQTSQTPDSGTVDIGYHYPAPLTAVDFSDPDLCPNTGSNPQYPIDFLSNNGLGSPDYWGGTVSILAPATTPHGTLVQSSPPTDYNYTPNSCYEGSDTFTYQMSDDLFTSSPGTVVLGITDQSNPSYSPDPASTPTGQPLSITLYANQTCDSPMTLTVPSITTAGGTLAFVSGDPSSGEIYTYTPPADFTGPDSFEFRAVDGCGYSTAALVLINVGSGGPFTEVTPVNSPVGIDYSPTANALVVSYNYSSGSPNNFKLVSVDGSGALKITSPFSAVANVSDEVEVATVKSTTANGFTKGDIYFGNTTDIGWVSANGQNFTLDWGTLSSGGNVNTVSLRGGLYLDQTGVFANDLIAVTGDPLPDNAVKGVWQIDAQGNSKLFANIATKHLEGVITLPNDSNTWGPWAGKIITGDEDEGVIYAIDSSGNVTSYLIGIGSPESFILIPSGQDLYLCDQDAGGRLLELPSSIFNGYAGDLLIVQEGGINGTTPALFIVSWDGTQSAFVTRMIDASPFGISDLEDAAFAPINLPSQPLQ